MNPLVLLTATLALAEPPEAPEAESPAGLETDAPEPSDPSEEVGTIALPEAEPELDSALEDPSPVSLPGEDGGLADVLGSWQAQEREVWGAANFLRPTLALVVTEQVHPVSLGVQAGRRWWQLKDGLKASFTVQGTADFALAGGKGSSDLAVSTLGGPWLGRVGVQLGPGLSWSRWSLGRESLVGASGLDLWALAVADLELVHLYAGVVPRFFLGGERPAATLKPLGLGDELGLRGGGGLTLGGVRLGLGWVRQFTAIGPIDRYSLNLRLLLL